MRKPIAFGEVVASPKYSIRQVAARRLLPPPTKTTYGTIAIRVGLRPTLLWFVKQLWPHFRVGGRGRGRRSGRGSVLISRLVLPSAVRRAT